MKNSPNLIFLDRDGTLIEDKGYLHDPNEVKILPGVIEGLKKLSCAGFKFLVLTNQSGIGRGYFEESDMFLVNTKISRLLSEEGIDILKFYYCPHRPEDDCDCRKPKPGMVFSACSELGFSIDDIYCIIGDKESDVKLAENIGVRSVLVLTGYGKSSAEDHKSAYCIAADIREAADLIIDELRK